MIFFLCSMFILDPIESTHTVKVPIVQEWHGDQPKMKEKKNFVIKTKPQFVKVWRLSNREEPIPDIDFKKETAMAVFIGQRGSAGFSVVITKIEKTPDNNLNIFVKEIEPSKTDVVATILTYPYVVFTISRIENLKRVIVIKNKGD